jgi:ABC-2 type transport system permease protein
VIRSAEGVSPVVNAIVLPMAFVSGSFGPTEDYPEFVQALAAVLPLSYLVDLLVAIALDGETLWSQWRPIAVIAVWGAAGFLVAFRWFRWEPRHGVS